VLARPAHDIGDAIVGMSVVEQARIVDFQEPRDRIRRFRKSRRGQRAPHEHLRAFAHHLRDRVLRQRRRVELGEQIVDRIGEVAGRIDEGAVEIERDQAAEYVAHDVGVSHTVTRTTGRPCSRETSKINRAIRSTVGLLSMT